MISFIWDNEIIQKRGCLNMKVFISWSGNKSHKVGLIFREWLPSVIQS